MLDTPPSSLETTFHLGVTLGEENEKLVRSILPNAEENLKAAQCFLAEIGNPDESLTQHVFQHVFYFTH